MSILGSIITMLIMLSIMVVLHEFGHFIVARMFHIKVNEFSIFMGPKIYSHVSKKTGTKFSIRCIPLGGYCAMADENGQDQTVGEGSFYNKPRRVRAAVFVAGPLMNVLWALVLVIIISATTGYSTNRVAMIQEGGLYATYSDPDDPDFRTEVGDRIISYDGYMVLNSTDYSLFKQMDEDYITVLEIEKEDGTVKTCTFDRTPAEGETGMKYLGLSIEYVEEPGFFGVIWNSLKYLLTLVRSVLYSLLWLITGRVGMEAVSGPVGITTVVDSVLTAEANIWAKVLTLVDMMALISVNLGIFNMIPFPGLDGGQLALVGLEALRGGKKLPPEKQGMISFFGLAVLIVLAVVIMGSDIFKIVSGG